MTLGDRLRQARETKGWSLVDVAAKTGWHFSTIAGWERGVRKPDPDKLATLARLYDVSADVLLGLTEDPPPEHHRKLTPDEQLAEMGIWMRGLGATEDDVRLIKELIERRQELQKRAKGPNGGGGDRH